MFARLGLDFASIPIPRNYLASYLNSRLLLADRTSSWLKLPASRKLISKPKLLSNYKPHTWKLRICPVFLPRRLPRHSATSRRMLTTTAGGCGQAFSAIIVSPQFEKKTTLARHRLVNTALKAEVAAIHAWTPKCYTPEQWERQRLEGSQAVAPGIATTGEVVTGTTA